MIEEFEKMEAEAPWPQFSGYIDLSKSLPSCTLPVTNRSRLGGEAQAYITPWTNF